MQSSLFWVFFNLLLWTPEANDEPLNMNYLYLQWGNDHCWIYETKQLLKDAKDKILDLHEPGTVGTIIQKWPKWPSTTLCLQLHVRPCLMGGWQGCLTSVLGNKDFSTKDYVMFCLRIEYLFHSLIWKSVYNFYVTCLFWICSRYSVSSCSNETTTWITARSLLHKGANLQI